MAADGDQRLISQRMFRHAHAAGIKHRLERARTVGTADLNAVHRLELQGRLCPPYKRFHLTGIGARYMTLNPSYMTLANPSVAIVLRESGTSGKPRR
jgi:hypothetical protein